MRKPIQDEFTHLRISRQRKYKMRMKRDKRCTECGEPAAYASRCLAHLVRARERQRKKRGLKRRYYRTVSYRWAEILKSGKRLPKELAKAAALPAPDATSN